MHIAHNIHTVYHMVVTRQNKITYFMTVLHLHYFKKLFLNIKVHTQYKARSTLCLFQFLLSVCNDHIDYSRLYSYKKSMDLAQIQ